MTQQLKSFLSGKWVSGEGQGAALHNPTTEEVVAYTSTQGLDLGSALAFARDRGGSGLRELSFAQRGEMLAKMASAIHDFRDEFLDLATLNGGNTRSDAKFDVDGATFTLSWYAKLG